MTMTLVIDQRRQSDRREKKIEDLSTLSNVIFIIELRIDEEKKKKTCVSYHILIDINGFYNVKN